MGVRGPARDEDSAGEQHPQRLQSSFLREYEGYVWSLQQSHRQCRCIGKYHFYIISLLGFTHVLLSVISYLLTFLLKNHFNSQQIDVLDSPLLINHGRSHFFHILQLSFSILLELNYFYKFPYDNIQGHPIHIFVLHIYVCKVNFKSYTVTYYLLFPMETILSPKIIVLT